MTTTAPLPTGLSVTVERFLAAIVGGTGVAPDLLAPEVTLDATVPGWRFTLTGRDAVARQYDGWFAAPATFEELERFSVDGGEVATYLLAWVDAGTPFAAHHCHVLSLDAEGRITRDLFFCGGRWDAARLAEMAVAEHAG